MIYLGHIKYMNHIILGETGGEPARPVYSGGDCWEKCQCVGPGVLVRNWSLTLTLLYFLSVGSAGELHLHFSYIWVPKVPC